MYKKIIREAALICDKVTDAINKRNRGLLNQFNCKSYCPGEDVLIDILNKLVIEIKDVEPECSIRINRELQGLRTSNCLNPFSFGAIVALVSVLKMKYLADFRESKKIFISHSSKDKYIVNSFIKEILKVGCRFKDNEIFCTLDSNSIRTGDDFREKIIENMRQCDYILLFLSGNYNSSDVCKNEMGAAWALNGKRILPFVLPGISFDQMGFLNVVKQGAYITDKAKLDEFYQELCDNYELKPDWITYNKSKDDFINILGR